MVSVVRARYCCTVDTAYTKQPSSGHIFLSQSVLSSS